MNITSFCSYSSKCNKKVSYKKYQNMTAKLYTENHNAKSWLYLNGNTRRYIKLTLAHGKTKTTPTHSGKYRFVEQISVQFTALGESNRAVQTFGALTFVELIGESATASRHCVPCEKQCAFVSWQLHIFQVSRKSKICNIQRLMLVCLWPVGVMCVMCSSAGNLSTNDQSGLCLMLLSTALSNIKL